MKEFIEFVSISGEKYFIKKSAFVGYGINDENALLIFTFDSIYISIKEFERIKGELL